MTDNHEHEAEHKFVRRRLDELAKRVDELEREFRSMMLSLDATARDSSKTRETVERIDNTLRGHDGKNGLVSTVNKLATVEEERKRIRRESERDRRQFFLTQLGAVIMLALNAVVMGIQILVKLFAS